MHLLGLTLFGCGPFAHAELPFSAAGEPRQLTVLHAAPGTGKTLVAQAIAATRPGHATPLPEPMPWARASAEPRARGYAVCDWLLGADQPERPHPLRVVSPPGRGYDDDDEEALRRREQALFDRAARESGFAFAALPATRWFSRQPVMLSAPLRTIARRDPLSPLGDDGSRVDLTREVKQTLLYAGAAAALGRAQKSADLEASLLDEALREAVDRLLGLIGVGYIGVDPASLEPTFSLPDGARTSFDALPTRAKHLVAFAVVPLRTLFGAYPNRDPRLCEGVVTIDDAELHQDIPTQLELPARLRSALPNVQWLLTTAADALAAGCDTGEAVALRRVPERDQVQVFTGSAARVH